MKRTRAGFTMVECCAAATVLLAALVLAVGLLTGVARQRQAASAHAQAIVVADNLLERITGEPYSRVAAERADEWRRESNVDELLTDGAASIDVSDEAGSPPGKRIAVEVTWRATPTGPLSRHQVATWVYRRKAP